jgi:integrase
MDLPSASENGLIASTNIESSNGTINEIILAFIKHARTYYSKEGREFQQYKPVLRLLRHLYGDWPVHRFGPKALKGFRSSMIAKGWCRRVINRRVIRLRTMFRWAESEELVPAGMTHALSTVRGLRIGEQGVYESAGVMPAFWEDVVKVLPFCTSPVGAMLQLQCLTGMRSCEVRLMRGCEINRDSDKCWLYSPQQHKNSWRGNGQSRIVPLGPKCQEILCPWIQERGNLEYLFQPRLAVAEVNAKRRGGIARMRVQPQSRELLWLQASIHPLIKVICHGGIFKDDARCSGLLFNGDKVFYVQKVVVSRDAKATDLSVSGVAEVLQLQKSQR